MLNPVFRFGDQGFDRVNIQTPSPVHEVSVRVGGEPVVPIAVTMIGDSLQVDLPELVHRDSVEGEVARCISVILMPVYSDQMRS